MKEWTPTLSDMEMHYDKIDTHYDKIDTNCDRIDTNCDCEKTRNS